eukprot:1137563-Pelagomonas_calceolata.AAC.1
MGVHEASKQRVEILMLSPQLIRHVPPTATEPKAKKLPFRGHLCREHAYNKQFQALDESLWKNDKRGR